MQGDVRGSLWPQDLPCTRSDMPTHGDVGTYGARGHVQPKDQLGDRAMSSPQDLGSTAQLGGKGGFLGAQGTGATLLPPQL